MVQPVRIIELARRMIVLMGVRPRIPTEIVGLRPGQKPTDELAADENVAPFCEGIREVRRPQGTRPVAQCDFDDLLLPASKVDDRTRRQISRTVAALGPREPGWMRA
jgi:FlaA1/EpsC-like NDP-sugar epimerase